MEPTFVGGAAGVSGGEMTRQEDEAFTLKLKSAQLEQEHQARMTEAQAGYAAEAARFARENAINPGVASALEKRAGAPAGSFAGLQKGDLPGVEALTKVPAGVFSTSVATDQRGLPQAVVRKNYLGVEEGRDAIPDYNQNARLYDNISRLGGLTQQAHGLYQIINAKGNVGSTPGLTQLANLAAKAFPGFSTNEAARAQLMNLNKSMVVLQGEVAEAIPGGRASMGLGAGQEGYQINASDPPDIEANTYHNGLFQNYRQMKLLAPTVNVPEPFQSIFGMVPHDNQNVPLNGYFSGSKMYMSGHTDNSGNPKEIFDLDHPHIPIDSNTATGLLSHATQQGAQQAGGGGSARADRAAKFFSAQDAQK